MVDFNACENNYGTVVNGTMDSLRLKAKCMYIVPITQTNVVMAT
ncbi:hypothetical protein LCGC14_2555970, partial [marine sediment metagenome]